MTDRISPSYTLAAARPADIRSRSEREKFPGTPPHGSHGTITKQQARQGGLKETVGCSVGKRIMSSTAQQLSFWPVMLMEGHDLKYHTNSENT